MSDSVGKRDGTGLTTGRLLNWSARFAVAAVLLWLILRSVDLQEFSQVVIAPKWVPLIIMVVTALVFMFLGAVKLWILLGALAPVRLMTVVRYDVVAMAFGTFTPAAVGDFSLVAFLRREGVPAHQGLSTMLIDRAVTLALYGLVYLPLTLVLVVRTDQMLWLPVAMAVAIAIVLGLNWTPPFRQWLRERVVRRYVPRLEDFLRTFSDLLRMHPSRLLANIAVTLVRAVVAGAVIYAALLAAGTSADFLLVTVITNSLSLLNLIPISLSGFGLYEGGAVMIFGYLGLDSERVFAAFVFQRVYTIVSSLVFLALTRVVLPTPDRIDSPPAAELPS
jgi:uncharacterized protein (TIRG00374 family)